MRRCGFRFRQVLAALACLLLAAEARATITPISNVNFFHGLLDSTYGPGNYVRIDDDLDHLWNSSNATATYVDETDGFVPDFGYFAGAAGDTFHPLLLDIDQPGPVPASVPVPDLSPLRWGLRVETSLDQFLYNLNSNPADNGDSLDHMVTFRITGGPSTGNYVVGWESLFGGGDRDFTDVVIELAGVQLAVPEPGTCTLVVIGLAGLSLLRRSPRRVGNSPTSQTPNRAGCRGK